MKTTYKCWSEWDRCTDPDIDRIDGAYELTIDTIIALSDNHNKFKYKQYRSYDGDYIKKHYDVLTFSGIEYEMCWPNAGHFHAFTGKKINGDTVDKVRISEKHPMDDLFND